MVETLIYDRLRTHTPLTALVGSRVFPDKPTVNTAMPFVVYTIPDCDDSTTLSGASGVKRHTLQIEVWGVNQSTTLAVLTQCHEALNNWRGGNIQGAFFVTQGTLEAEEGYQGIAIFNVWADVATVTALPDSTGSVKTGQNFVELAACDHLLRLDCSGLSLDGVSLSVPDLSGFAALNSANVFTANQTVEGDVSALHAAFVSMTIGQLSIDEHGGITILTTSGYYPFTINRSSVFGGGIGVRCGPDGSLEARTLSTTDGFRATAFGAYVGVLGYTRIVFNTSGIDVYGGASGNNVMRLNAATGQTVDVFQCRGADGFNMFAVGANGTLLTNQTAANTTTGSKIARLPIYNRLGVLVGYIPIHDQ